VEGIRVILLLSSSEPVVVEDRWMGGMNASSGDCSLPSFRRGEGRRPALKVRVDRFHPEGDQVRVVSRKPIRLLSRIRTGGGFLYLLNCTQFTKRRS